MALGVAGPRFQATAEALVDPAVVKAIVERRGEDTERSTLLDIVRGSAWPGNYTARTLGHPHLERWRGREDEVVGNPQARQDYRNDVELGAIPLLPIWAGEGIDLITDVPSATDLVADLAAQAAVALDRAGRN
jgi:nitronate monooxygenase